ncbi:hypothetical protein Tco_0316208 [Tanacetum coccineum]
MFSLMKIGTPGSTDGANVEAYLRRLHVLGKSDLSGDKCRVQLGSSGALEYKVWSGVGVVCNLVDHLGYTPFIYTSEASLKDKIIMALGCPFVTKYHCGPSLSFCHQVLLWSLGLGPSDIVASLYHTVLLTPDLNHPSIVQLSLEYCSGIGCLYHKYLRRSKLIMTASFGWSGGLKSAPDVCSRGLLRMSASSWRGLLGLSLELRVVDCHYLFLISRRDRPHQPLGGRKKKILNPRESKILEYMPMAISPAGRFIIIKLGSGRRGLKSKGIS